jgi:hypothetical protein
MSRANVEIVREVMELWDRARNREQSPDDLTHRLAKLVATEAQIDMSRRVFNPEVYDGEAGMRRLLQEISEVWEEFWVTPERMIDARERVIVIESLRGRGKGTGVETRSLDRARWEVVHMATYYDPQDALKAAGLAG